MVKEKEYSEYNEHIYHYVRQIKKERQYVTYNPNIPERNKGRIFELCRNRKLKDMSKEVNI